MRRDIVSRILLILYTIYFALAAPVQVQEKHKARVDVVHKPRDVITVWKRGGGDVEKLAGVFSQMLDKPVESSGTHASSSSAPLGLDHDSELGNEVQVPSLNPSSSTANPNMLKGPSSPSWTTTSAQDDVGWRPSGQSNGPYSWYIKSTGARNPGPSEEPDFDWNKINLEEGPPQKRPKLASSKEFGQTDEEAEKVRLSRPPSNPGFSDLGEQPPQKRPKLASSKEFGQTDEDQVAEKVQLSVPQSNPGPSDLVEQPPQERPKLASSKEFGQTDEDQVAEKVQLSVPPSNPGLSDLVEQPPQKRPKLASSKEFGQTNEGQVQHLQLPSPLSNPGPLNPSERSLDPGE